MPVRTPWFPTYAVVRALLPILDGLRKSEVTRSKPNRARSG